MKRYRFDIKHIEVIFEDSVLENLYSNIQQAKNDHERGGLLLGRIFPDDNKIVVTEVTTPTPISSGITTLCVDLEDANKYMRRRWKESGGKITYIGDWHTHPEQRPSPSMTDRFTFFDTYRNSRIDQNLLLCVIVGTEPALNQGIWVGAQSGFGLYRMQRIVGSNLFVR